jgi:Flp pilus assembly protein TadB
VSVWLLCVGAWLALPGDSLRRLPRRPSRLPRVSGADAAAGVAAVAVALIVGGLTGWLIGIAAAVVIRVVLGRLSDEEPSRRDDLARQVPDAVDCLASCLAAGAPLWPAAAVVADAFGDPIAGVLRRCVAKHALGSPYEETFAELLAQPSLAPVGRVLLRSIESGAALTEALVTCSQRLRQDRAAELERRARAVGVKAVAPLGLCFLPAFVVLAVVPIVGSLVRTLF